MKTLISTSAFAFVVMCLIITSTSHAQDTGTNSITSYTELGDVLARVNGTPILTKNVVPARLLQSRNLDIVRLIAPRLRQAVDQELIAQRAAAESLADSPEYAERVRELESNAARGEVRLLVHLYLRTFPELAGVRDPQTPSEAEIDAYLTEHAVKFEGVPEEAHSVLARNQMTRELSITANTAYSAWLKQRLSNVRFTVNGEAVPSAVIDRAVAATGPVRLPNADPREHAALLRHVRDMLLVAEAQARGVAPDMIAGETELVRALVLTAELEAAGHKLILGDVPGLDGLLDALRGQRPPPGAVFMTMTDLILAADARRKGIDKGPEFVKGRAAGAKAAATKRAGILTEVYYARHGLDAAAVAVSDGEATARYYWYMGKLTVKPKWGDNQEEAVEAIREQLQQTRLRWKRQGYLEALRAAAKIEYMIELPTDIRGL